MDSLDATGYGLALMSGGIGLLLVGLDLWVLWLLVERIIDRNQGA